MTHPMKRPDTIHNGPTRQIANHALIGFDRRRPRLDDLIAEAQRKAESGCSVEERDGIEFLELPTTRARLAQMALEQEQ